MVIEYGLREVLSRESATPAYFTSNLSAKWKSIARGLFVTLPLKTRQRTDNLGQLIVGQLMTVKDALKINTCVARTIEHFLSG